MYSDADILSLAMNQVKWRKQNGLFYSKGGKGIEKQPAISKRRASGYGAGCSSGNNRIVRERSKGEINALYEQTKRR